MLEAIAPGDMPNGNLIETPDFTLRQMPSVRMTNMRGRSEDAAFGTICGTVIGLPLPIVPNRFASADGRHCLWQGPDEWLIVDGSAQGGDLAAQLDAALADCHHAVTDVSGNRTILRLSGPGSVELLSAGCSLDFSVELALAGIVVQTILARTPVTIMRVDEAPTFDLLVRRSLASYVQAWLVHAAGSGLRRG